MLSFKNTEIAYSDVSTRQLRIERNLYRIVNSKWKFKILKSSVLAFNFLHIPYVWLIGRKQQERFWGGVTMTDCLCSANRLWERDIYTTIDYKLNHIASLDPDKYFNSIVELFGFTTQTPKIAFFTLKIERLIETRILKILSTKKILNKADSKKYEIFRSRIRLLCKLAYKHNKPIVIEPAELQTQNIINQISEEMMMEFNKENAIVYISLHFNQIESTNFLHKLHYDTQKDEFIAGVKIIKGNRINTKQKKQFNNSDNSIIYKSDTEIQRAYTDAIKFCINNIDSFSIICCSHTEKNIIFTLSLMNTQRIAPKDGRIYFAQQLGLGNNISYNLAKSGYNVVKKLPLGQSKQILPYLFKKIELYPYISERTKREIELINTELLRRKRLKD